MKRKIISCFCLFALLISVVSFVSCSDDSIATGRKADENNNTSGSNNTSNEQSEAALSSNVGSKSEYTLYTDSEPIETESIIITSRSPICYGGNNYALSLHFVITNKELKTNYYSIKNVKLIKENTNVEYSVSVRDTEISLDAELSYQLTFSATIPSSIVTDHYKLSFELNAYEITYYLYETPDELRVDRTVRYYVSNQLIQTVTVKDKHQLDSLYVYETEDHMYYCDTWSWYINQTYETTFSISTPITKDIDLYGKLTANLSWLTTGSDVYSFINGVNHVPSNGILLIPETLQGKQLCISNYAIRNLDVSKIYIPKTVHTIYSGNFTGLGQAIIYYEGSEAEWRALFYNPSDVVTTNVIYNTKYSR